MSPHIVTGASTFCTFDSSTSISLAFWHSIFTSFSLRYSHRLWYISIRNQRFGLLLSSTNKSWGQPLIYSPQPFYLLVKITCAHLCPPSDEACVQSLPLDCLFSEIGWEMTIFASGTSWQSLPQNNTNAIASLVPCLDTVKTVKKTRGNHAIWLKSSDFYSSTSQSFRPLTHTPSLSSFFAQELFIDCSCSL